MFGCPLQRLATCLIFCQPPPSALRTTQADAWTVCHDAVHEAVKPSWSSAKRCIKIQQNNVERSSPSSLQHPDHHLHLTYRVYHQALGFRLTHITVLNTNSTPLNLAKPAVTCTCSSPISYAYDLQRQSVLDSSCPKEGVAFSYEGRQLQTSGPCFWSFRTKPACCLQAKWTRIKHDRHPSVIPIVTRDVLGRELGWPVTTTHASTTRRSRLSSNVIIELNCLVTFYFTLER